MKFTINAKELATALKPLMALIPKRCFAEEFGCIHFLCFEKTVYALAYDANSQTLIKLVLNRISGFVYNDSTDCVGFRINAAKLQKLLAGFKKANVTFSISSKSLTIAANELDFNIEFEPSTLTLPVVANEATVAIDCRDSRITAVRNAYVYAHKDATYSNMHGVYVEYSDSDITAITGTNSHVLFSACEPRDNGAHSGIIHYIAAGALVKIFDACNPDYFVIGKKPVEILGKENTCFIVVCGPYLVYTKDVDSQFVPFRNIMRYEHTTTAIVLLSDLQGVLNSFKPHVNTGAKQLFYNFRNGKKLEICCKNVDTKFLSTAKVDCSFEENAQDCIIALGCDLLQIVLNSLPDDCTHVRFELNSSGSAVFISENELGSLFAKRIIMPVMISSSLSENNWDTFTNPELCDFKGNDSGLSTNCYN